MKTNTASVPRAAAVCLLALLLALSMSPAWAQANLRAAAMANNISDLRSSTVTSLSEPPRLSRAPEGHLLYYGAPPAGYVPVSLQSPNRSSSEVASAFMSQYATAFGLYSSAFTFGVNRERTVGGRTYIHLTQNYSNLPVFGAEIVIQVNSNGVEAAISDLLTDTTLLDDGTIPLTPTIDELNAEIVALETAFGQLKSEQPELTKEDIEDIRTSLYVRNTPGLLLFAPDVVGAKGTPHPCWLVDIALPERYTYAERFLVNAGNGSVSFHYPLVYSALDRNVCDCNENWWCVNTRDEGDPAIGVSDTDDAYDMLESVYDYFNTSNYGYRDSFDDAGATIISKTRWFDILICGLTPPCKNAAWDGEKLKFGTGMVVDDVMAHEYTHVITEYTAGLIYANESGALNESFSDVFGEFFDLDYSTESSSVRWLIGEDSTVGVHRDMAEPTSYDCPDSYHSEYFYLRTSTGHFVHINSGVSNKLCYLLTDGDTFHGRTITGMGVDSVASLYWECLTNMLGTAPDYRYFYYAMTQSAVNLGWTTAQRENLEQACRAVEIDSTRGGLFVMADGGEPLVHFTSKGDVILYKGQILTEQTITPNAGRSEFIITRAVGTPLLLVDPVTGDLKIAGKLYEGAGTVLLFPQEKFVLKDGEGTIRIFLNSAMYADSFLEPESPYFIPPGSLILEGSVITQ